MNIADRAGIRQWLVAGLMALASTVGSAANQPAHAADSIKIGFIGTLSGPGGTTGTQSLAAVQLALDQHHGQVGGVPATVITGDDQQKPDIGRQLAEKMVFSDRVDVMITATFSNVLLALYPSVVDNKKVLFSASAGPSLIAGKRCSPYFFNTSWQGDNLAEAMGAYLQKQSMPGVFTLAPNYAAGKDVIAGLRRYYQGTIVGERYTPLSQMDFAAELAEIRAANPPAVFAFYPGGLGIQFMKQYSESGLDRTLKLYTAYTIDETTLPAIGDAAVGSLLTDFWSTTLDNPQNRAFVASYKAKTHETPASNAAASYDTMNILDAAVQSLHGNIADTDALIKAVEVVKFSSVRGNFRFANDHFPVQDYYVGQVRRGADGVREIVLGDMILKDHGNAYQAECPMK